MINLILLINILINYNISAFAQEHKYLFKVEPNINLNILYKQ